MAQILSSGLETGNLSEWTGTTTQGTGVTLEANTTAKRSGTYGLFSSGTTGGITWVSRVFQNFSGLTSNYFHFQFRLYIATANTNGTLQFCRINSSTHFNYLRLTRSSTPTWRAHIKQRDGVATNSVVTGGIPTGQWVKIDILLDRSTSGTNVWKMWVDDVLKVDYSDSTTGTGDAPNEITLGLAEDAWPATGTAYYDDVYVWDDADNIPGASSGSTYTETGAATSAMIATGADAADMVDTGAGITSLVASGADAQITEDTGTGISNLVASGADAQITEDTGTGVLGSSASGTDSLDTIYEETGAGISNLVASGADTQITEDTGAGITSLVGTGTDTQITEDTGTGVLGSSASGDDSTTVIYNETGTASSSMTASGLDIAVMIDTGAGISSLVASGADAQITEDTGAAATPSLASGSEFAVLIDTGAGISSLVASGADSFSGSGNYEETGTASSDLSASGLDVADMVETGTGVTVMLASGTVNQGLESLTISTRRHARVVHELRHARLGRPPQARPLAARDED
jgi:hypothetical protein